METLQKDYIKSFCCELRYRNYSESAVRTDRELLERFQKWAKVPLNEITTDQFKSYLHHRMTVEKKSVSTTNQCISAFKVLQMGAELILSPAYTHDCTCRWIR